MDVKQLAQATIDSFTDRSFRTQAKDFADADVVVVDKPTGQELHGPDGFVQFNDGFVAAMPDVSGTALEHTVSGNKVVSRVHGKGTFTGTFHTPQGDVPGDGNSLDLEYRLEQEFNDAGKLVRFVADYNMQDFMKQLGLG